MTRPKARVMWACFDRDGEMHWSLRETRKGARSLLAYLNTNTARVGAAKWWRTARIQITELHPRKKARRG